MKCIISSTCIIIDYRKDEPKFLIVKRSCKGSFPNMWTVPGGKFEKKDFVNKAKRTSIHWYRVIEDSLKREIREEIGVEINNPEFLTSMVYMKNNIPNVILSFWVEEYYDNIKLNNELVDYKWVTLKEAKNYNLIEGIYDELYLLKNGLR